MKGAQYNPLFASPSLASKTLPVVISNDVLDDAGTGLVHMAPSHGHEDYQAFLSLGLLQDNPLINIVDPQGRYNSEVETLCGKDVGSRLVGLEVLFKGNKEILTLLEEAGPGNRLLGVERHRHRYPYDWRTKKPLIIRATAQWFANLEEVKGKALEALERVEFYPPICGYFSLEFKCGDLMVLCSKKSIGSLCQRTI
jgi:isoleucyl-tRNA synthetase